MKSNLSLFIVFLTISTSAGSRILFVFPTPSKSQMIVGQSLAKILTENDHKVTVVSAFPLENSVKNYIDVKIELKNELKQVFKSFMSESSEKFSFEEMHQMFRIADEIGAIFMKSLEMKKLLDEEKFDLLILGYVPLNNFMLGLADHFKCPSILLNTAEVHNSILEIIGNPLEISSVPHFLISSSKMDNLVSRVKNFIISSFDFLVETYVDSLEEGKFR